MFSAYGRTRNNSASIAFTYFDRDNILIRLTPKNGANDVLIPMEELESFIFVFKRDYMGGKREKDQTSLQDTPQND